MKRIGSLAGMIEEVSARMPLAHKREERMAFNHEAPLDDIDWGILTELQTNARITFSELGRRVSLTPPAVAERVRRLEDGGLIAGYRVELDHALLGLPITAFIRMRAAGSTDCLELGDRVRDVPEILECHRVTGEDSYIAKVAVRSVEHLQDLIDRLMPLAETITAITLSSPVTHRTVERSQVEPESPRGRSRRRSA
jgi:Lrp/AsnC family transcriptional regulator, leucine-responsive regulatory protein